jgi:HAMP domain-containing protein
MVDQLNAFASEVTHLVREIGNDGKLGAQAEVRGIAGTWKDLLNNINFMSANLTEQVRNISEVTYAVARGNLSKKITVQVRGELLDLKTMINGMIDQLNVFASECNRITHEIGAGKFGGQVEVPGVDGSWQDFVTNLNRMSTTLTVS